MTELERALVVVGHELDVPATPDLAPAVLAGLNRSRRAGRPRWALAVALAVLALLAATLAIPDARSALLRILHIGGESIEFVDELPPVQAQPDLGLILGQRVSLAEARRSAGFELRELEEPPDRVYLGEHRTVWFLYGTEARVRLLVAQTSRLAFNSALISQKLVGPDTKVEEVSVDGSPGLFLSGAPHVVLLLDATGGVVEESTRLARDVLVWSEGVVAYRLEGDFTPDDAVELARSLR
jgi:hypothetical protein